MDPNVTLDQMRMLASRILKRANVGSDADQLAELVCAMDSHLRAGGFLPKSWEPAEIHRQVIEDARR